MTRRSCCAVEGTFGNVIVRFLFCILHQDRQMGFAGFTLEHVLRLPHVNHILLVVVGGVVGTSAASLRLPQSSLSCFPVGGNHRSNCSHSNFFNSAIATAHCCLAACCLITGWKKHVRKQQQKRRNKQHVKPSTRLRQQRKQLSCVKEEKWQGRSVGRGWAGLGWAGWGAAAQKLCQLSSSDG